MVLVIMTVVVSPLWIVCAVVVTVRVTLQLDRSRARAITTSRIMAAMASHDAHLMIVPLVGKEVDRPERSAGKNWCLVGLNIILNTSC